MDAIIRPMLTEKTMAYVEKENKIMFMVSRKATKAQVKKAIEKIYGEKVKTVNTHISRKGDKRAYIRFERKSAALDVATKLGVM